MNSAQELLVSLLQNRWKSLPETFYSQIPEIRDSVNELIKTDLNESILSTVLQALGIAAGVTFMYVMCTYGHKIQLWRT